MPSPPAPDIGMFMLIPVARRGADRGAHLRLGLEAAALQRQCPQRLPPRLNQVQIGRIFRRKYILPARIGQTKQQDIGGPMSTQVIHNRIDPFRLLEVVFHLVAGGGPRCGVPGATVRCLARRLWCGDAADCGAVGRCRHCNQRLLPGTMLWLL
jgi:hypothetical protein